MQIYLLTTAQAARIPEEYGGKWFPERMERAARFRRAADTIRCIGAGALIAYAVGVKEDEIRTGEYGKPFVPGGPCFSLSHSGDYIALAVDDTEVGIDIEERKPGHLGVAPSVLCPEELAWMEEEPVERFYRLWTMKESVSKCLGLGLQLPFRSFSVLPMTGNQPVILEGRTLYGHAESIGDHALSVCAGHPMEALRPVNLTAEELLRP